jgi:hypothetical protein
LVHFNNMERSIFIHVSAIINAVSLEYEYVLCALCDIVCVVGVVDIVGVNADESRRISAISNQPPDISTFRLV